MPTPLLNSSQHFNLTLLYRKDSAFLGEHWSLGVPIEVLPLSYHPVQQRIRNTLGGEPKLRLAKSKAVSRVQPPWPCYLPFFPPFLSPSLHLFVPSYLPPFLPPFLPIPPPLGRSACLSRCYPSHITQYNSGSETLSVGNRN